MPLLASLHPLPPTPIHLRRRSSVSPTSFRSPIRRRLPRQGLSGCVRSPTRSPPSSRMSVAATNGSPTPPSQDSLSYAKAFWVTRDIIAWNVSEDVTACYLYASKCANLYLTDSVEGYDEKILLKLDVGGLPTHVLRKFPHIRGYKSFEVPTAAHVVNLLKSQLAIASYNGEGKCCDITGLQLPGVLDDVYAYTGPLGATFTAEAIALHLWAPTAQIVRAFIYDDPTISDPMESVLLEEVKGVWSVVGSRRWEGCYYAYEISVFHPHTLKIETYIATDPYAKGLSSDGRRSLLVDLDSPNFKPQRWDALADEKPELLSFSDISIYELHIRDFSINDQTVEPEYRGGYLAFTSQDSAGVRHLRGLSKAGLTHVHLLPCFHFAGVDDVKDNWKSVDFQNLEKLPPDSEQQQAAIMAIKDEDGYNWGYNPVLWGVPKGSYASNSDGPCRILEFRKMVQALNHLGLRVVLDVVYNHMHASGFLDENSVLDKVVPGYYLRRSNDGTIEHSTCVNNTASEHCMVERLILDDLLCWAVHYKVDGFRFDLMGHIMKNTMVKAMSALQGLKKDIHGVDGTKIYIYGEGWDFGEVAKNGRGINASQFNLCGTGIGSFNDRIRDAVLGGSPFGHPLQQGFATGLSLLPNEYNQGTKAHIEETLAVLKDHILVGLAANLKDYVVTNYCGKAVKGSEVFLYDGSPVAYALNPSETINYVSAHDNETLFDVVSLKTPFGLSVDERCRINHLATSLVALSQGIPFFHCGDEMLRSKSLDRDSYNSGDWFNRVDFSYECNNWGVGLPPREKNEWNWPLIKPRLGNTSFKPQKRHILAAVDNFKDLLKIRYSSPLFRLKTANIIQERVQFHNTGPSWVPGVIVMSIADGYEGMPGLLQLDLNFSLIVVVFNASPTEASFTSRSMKARNLQLHPVQQMSSDAEVKNSKYEASSGSFLVPSWTTAVFVETR